MHTVILNHYPPVVKQIKDIQQIAKAEDIEFTKLNAGIDQVIRNMFVYTSDEAGIERFEKLLGVEPKPGQSLEDRKVYIIFRMNRKKMSLSELIKMLESYCEGIRLINDIANMEMVVEMNVNTVSMETLNDMLDEILPLNIYFRFALKMKVARAKIFALHEKEEKIKVKPKLKKQVSTEGERSVRAAVYSKVDLKVKTSTATRLSAGTNQRVFARMGALNVVKVKTYTQRNLRAESGVETVTRAYQKEMHGIKISSKGREQ